MSLANLFPQNGWKPEGALGGLVAGEMYGYGLENLQDLKRQRDLEDAMRANKLEKENLDKPLEAAKRQYELESELPLKRAKNTTDLDWNTSGNARREKEVKLSTEEADLQKKQYAQDALERGEWALQADTMAKNAGGNPLAINPDAWKAHMARRPKSLTYLNGDLPSVENLKRISDAAQAYVMDGATRRKIAEGEPGLKNQKEIAAAHDIVLRQNNADTNATTLKAAQIRANNSGKKASVGEQSLDILMNAVEGDNPELLTPKVVAAAERQLYLDALKKPSKAAEMERIMTLMNQQGKTPQEIEAKLTEIALLDAPEEYRKALMWAKSKVGMGKAEPAADTTGKKRKRFDANGNELP